MDLDGRIYQIDKKLNDTLKENNWVAIQSKQLDLKTQQG